MIPLIILESLKLVNLILEGIPVEERQRNYLTFAGFLDKLATPGDSPDLLAGLRDLLKELASSTPTVLP